MPFHVTVLYAGLNGLIVVALTFYVIAYRFANKVSIGHDGHPNLERRVRVHGNAVETIPLALILIGFLEFYQTSSYVLHGLGAALTIGRVLHAVGLSRTLEVNVGRSLGIVLTMTVISTASILAILIGLGFGAV
jgi:uncharacterized membrane protein YecN with MAPEG domain